MISYLRRPAGAEEEVAAPQVQHLLLGLQSCIDNGGLINSGGEIKGRRTHAHDLLRTVEGVLREIQLEPRGRLAAGGAISGRERRPAPLGGVGGDGSTREVGHGGIGAQQHVHRPQAPLHRDFHQQPRQLRRRPLRQRRQRATQQRHHARADVRARRGRGLRGQGAPDVRPGRRECNLDRLTMRAYVGS